MIQCSYDLKKKIKIIISSNNDELFHIYNILDDLSKQLYVNGINVYIINNHPNEKFKKLIEFKKKYLINLNIKIINESLLLNREYDNENIPYVLYMQSDVRFDSKWFLFNVYDRLHRKHKELIICELYPNSHSICSKIAFKLYNIINKYITFKYPIVIGSCFCLRNEDFLEINKMNGDGALLNDYALGHNIPLNKCGVMNGGMKKCDTKLKKMGYLLIFKKLFKKIQNYEHILLQSNIENN